jgi:uncharacterized protein YegL
MRADLTEIAFVLDRSGSMQAIAGDAIGGFNAFLAQQQAERGAARLTLVLFDHEYLVAAEHVEIGAVAPLDERSYVPRGMTALLDAVGRTVDAVGVRLAQTPEEERPAKVIVAILTDGLENASREYGYGRVAEMIRHQQEKYGWEFVFLAANQDAMAAAGKLAIRAQDAVAFEATGAGVRMAMARVSEETSRRRAGR